MALPPAAQVTDMNDPQLLMTAVLVVVVLFCLAAILYISIVWD